MGIPRLIAALIALAGASACAQDVVREAPSHATFTAPLTSNFVVADFDNDQKADAAVLFRSLGSSKSGTYRVELHLTHHPDAVIDFDSAEFGHDISARDIDHDNDTDLVVERLLTEQGVRVWLNDGHGGFTEGDVRDYPSTCFQYPHRCDASREVTARS